MADKVLGAKRKSAEPNQPEDHRQPRTAHSTQKTRVFISYSSKDLSIARNIAKVLRERDTDALYDENLSAGDRFTEQIKNFIAHAHVFLPVLTEQAGTSKWVQQEIGYAVALRVPVVPVVIRCDPGEFLHGIQAIRLPDESLDPFRKWLSTGGLESRVMQAEKDRPALYECADTTDERAGLIAAYANAVVGMERYGKVRQLGGLSSFHIPVEAIRDDVWVKRSGTKGSTLNHRLVLREERLALTKHAVKAGCKLILDAGLNFDTLGNEATLTRLRSIRNFFREMNDARCQAALGTDLAENLLIVGDWFAARSVYPKGGEGYRQTIFTRHAPTIKRMIEYFDDDFAQTLGNVKPLESRRHALRAIDKRMKQLEEAGSLPV